MGVSLYSEETEISNLVIGSGPSGVSVAHALLARGLSVTMIDGGKQPASEVEELRKRLLENPLENWDPIDVAAWTEPQFNTPEGQVRRFGSDFAMEPAENILTETTPLALRSSRAAGGLSNLWGAAVLPVYEEDIKDWPISIADLSPHYDAVAKFLPISGQRDPLERLFPNISMSDRHQLPRTVQGQSLLQRSHAQQEKLKSLGATIGASRLAVSDDCKMCGMCLHGCPWSLIWSARRTLSELQTHPNFTYRPNVIAARFSETSNMVEVSTSTGTVLRAQRLFVAAGVLESARLMLSSSSQLGELVLKDSQHYFLPSLHRWRVRGRPDRVPLNTLPQAFLELEDRSISPYLQHAQLYTWNEFFDRDLVENYGHKLPGSTPFWRLLARRLIVSQVFLHSSHSSPIALTLTSNDKLVPHIKHAEELDGVVRKSTAAVARVLRSVGLMPLTFATRVGAPGSSFHVGATLPMSTESRKTTTDLLGRPNGLKRVHLVDASVLPAITATTITFSVMANAHRIGASAPIN